ncbi:MAG: glycosyltransferase [Chloroflexi bacterium]|nr:glycosyltransferase [Chloroflexota bacterium]
MNTGNTTVNAASIDEAQSVSALGATGRPPISIFRVLVSVAALVVALVTVGLLADWPLLAEALRELGKQPYLVPVLVIVYSSAFLLRAIAWKALMVSGGNTFKLLGALQAALLVNHLAPLKLGEFVRPLAAARAGVPLAEAATTTAVARVLDFVALLVIAASVGSFVSLSAGEGRWLQGLALPAVVIAGICGLLLVLRWRRLHDWLPELLRTRFDIMQSQLRQVSGRRLATAAAWTLPSWILEAVVIIVAARALGIELSLAAAISVTAFTILFQAFHITPGGIGVYEAVMTGALFAHGIPWEEGLALAVATHGLKFAYSYTIALAFSFTALVGLRRMPSLNPLNHLRGSSDGAKSASSFEVVAARLWNVLNEGKPFTPVFTLGIIALLSVPHLGDGGYWLRAAGALLALVPLFVVFYRFDFPLRLRVTLWIYVGVFLAVFRFADLTAMALILGIYLTFTIFLWGTVYYHLRIGTSWLNFTRFWRLVLENPDPTSGNFLEQIPKLTLLVLAFQILVARPTPVTYLAVEGFVLLLAITALLLHQWFFTWPPAPSMVPTTKRAINGERISRRFITIVIDGCRADRLLEANTPYIDRLRSEGVDYIDTSTVYPARTVSGFSSMFTGAPPTVHGMTSNFVPSLGVKCESIFDALRKEGLNGKLVGIAHLIDAFGHNDVETVTAVTNNDDIDNALTARAQAVIQRDDPDLLILQLLSVDQTGHARGSYNSEYLEKIEESDRIIQRFLEWCDSIGYLDEATVVITADHGQGIGIGGHGHMSPTERYVPCILWGHGVETRGVIAEPHSVMDVTATIAYFLGVAPPEQSVGQVLGIAESEADVASRPVAVIIPAYNETENLPDTLARIPRRQFPNLKVIVVDDGSTDGTARLARDHGADVVISHTLNRGLGAALRTGLAAANELNARAAVYVDADGEYPPEQIPDLLEPILQGEADYVLGSRYLGKRQGQRAVRLLGNLVFTGLLCLATGRRITDGQTGFRAFSRRALECAEIIHDYNYAQVLTLDLLKKGMRMREVPISYSRRTRGRSFIGPKYLWRVPVRMLQEMLSK